MIGNWVKIENRVISNTALTRAMLFGVVLAIGIVSARSTPGRAGERADRRAEAAQEIELVPATTPIRLAQTVQQPVGNVNPDRPIRIDIVNAGDLGVLFELTQPGTIQRRLPPNGEISFGSTNMSFLPPPIYLVANPEQTEVGLNLYVVSTTNNVIEVVVSEQSSTIPGGRSLSVEPNGLVYVY